MSKVLITIIFTILAASNCCADSIFASETADGYVYIKGRKGLDDSYRFAVNSGVIKLQERIEGIWQPASMETGADSMWLGDYLGLCTAGHQFATESRVGGHYHFYAHSEMVDGLSTDESKMLNAYSYVERSIFQPDNSGEFTGTSLEFNFPSTTHSLVNAGHYQTGATAATSPVRVQIWSGVDDTGEPVFDQIYPTSEFPASTEIILQTTGYIEFELDTTYFLRYSSDTDFSLKTDAAVTTPWFAVDISMVREDNLLQTKLWISGDTWDAGDYFIDSRKVYICNTTGIQTGTFAGNSDKWDALEYESHAEQTQYWDRVDTTVSPTNAGDDIETSGKLRVTGGGIFLERTGNDPYLSFTKNATGQGQIRADSDMLGIYSPTGNTRYFGVDTGSGTTYCYDDLRVSESVYVNNEEVVDNLGDVLDTALPKSTNWDTAYTHSQDNTQAHSDYLTVEVDSIYTAWDKSTGISITESQISDLDHFVTEDETDPVYSAWDKSTGISITESQISDFQNYILTGSEADPIFNAWDKSTGISITESQISDLNHTGAFDGDIASIYNSAGDIQIQSNPNYGDVDFFGGTDVGNDENGGYIYLRRQAPEGNNYLRFYISANRTSFVHSNGDLTFQAQQPFTINSVTDSIYLKVGDNAGGKKIHFRDSDNDTVASINSDGWFYMDANKGGGWQVQRGSNNNIKTFMDSTYTDIRFEGAKEYNRIGTWIDKPFQIVTDSTNRVTVDKYGRVEMASSLTVNADITVLDDILAYGDVAARNLVSRGAFVFQDKSTQEEAGERHFSQGHTHTAVYNNNWYDADLESMSERDIHFSPDGLTMYIIGLADSGVGDCSIWEYPLTIPWDLSTVGTSTIKSIETYGGNQVGLFISTDGRRLWTVCTSNDTVIEYSMSPWNISNLTWVQAKDISGQETSPSAVFWSANGDRLFVAGDADNDIVAFSVTTEWDISGISWFEDFGTNINAPTGLHFSSDGRRMYVMDGSAEDDIHEFHLSSPWRIATARLVNLFDVSAENASPQGIFITADNSKIFMVGTGTPDGVYGYSLGLEVGGAIISNNGPMRPGRMTTTQRDALTATNGDIIYNVTTEAFNFYEDGSWTIK